MLAHCFGFYWFLQSHPVATETNTDAALLPKLSLIVTAYNEEKRILAKIESSLLIDYPGELEITIASDCSDDDTDMLVNGFSEQGVRLVRADQRLGKENAQRCAIEQASGDI